MSNYPTSNLGGTPDRGKRKTMAQVQEHLHRAQPTRTSNKGEQVNRETQRNKRNLKKNEKLLRTAKKKNAKVEGSITACTKKQDRDVLRRQ